MLTLLGTSAAAKAYRKTIKGLEKHSTGFDLTSVKMTVARLGDSARSLSNRNSIEFIVRVEDASSLRWLGSPHHQFH